MAKYKDLPFFELQPYLQGELLELRPLTESDFEALYKAASDPLIWELHPEPTRYQRNVFMKYFDSGIKSGGAFVIIDKRTQKIIGSSRYYEFKPDIKEIIIGYTFLAKSHWGGKYNAELKKLMLDHAFKFVDAVTFEVGEKNLRSRRAMEKIGGVLQGIKNYESSSPHAVYKITKTK